jgi:hypothetical protein
MDPLTLAGLGLSAGGAVAGLLSSGQGAAAQRAQNDVAFRNYYLQRQMAQEQMQLAKAGSVDARGNTTQFIPGVGWVSTPSDATRSIISASDGEERQQLTGDAIRRRLGSERNSTRSMAEGSAADSILAQVTTPYQETQNDVRSRLIARGVARAGSGPSAMRNRIGMQTLRQGGLGGGQTNALARITRDAQDTRRTAIADANYSAPTEASARTAATQGDLVNRYAALAQGARSQIGSPTQPSQIGSSLSEQLAARAKGAAYGSNTSGYISSPRVGSTETRTPVALDSLGAMLTQMARSRKGAGAPAEDRTNDERSGWSLFA